MLVVYQNNGLFVFSSLITILLYTCILMYHFVLKNTLSHSLNVWHGNVIRPGANNHNISPLKFMGTNDLLASSSLLVFTVKTQFKLQMVTHKQLHDIVAHWFPTFVVRFTYTTL